MLKVALINIDAFLMMSANSVAPDILKIRIFLLKGYDLTVSIHDVSNKVLSRDSNDIVNVDMWPK